MHPMKLVWDELAEGYTDSENSSAHTWSYSTHCNITGLQSHNIFCDCWLSPCTKNC